MSALANDQGAEHRSQWRNRTLRIDASRASSSLERHQTDVLLSVIVPVLNENVAFDLLPSLTTASREARATVRVFRGTVASRIPQLPFFQRRFFSNQ